MALTKREKDDVYMTVAIEMGRMFDILTNVYTKPDQTREAKLIAKIEIDIRKGWDHFKLPT